MKEFNDKEWEAFCKTWSNEPEKKKITGCDAFLIFFFAVKQKDRESSVALPSLSYIV